LFHVAGVARGVIGAPALFCAYLAATMHPTAAVGVAIGVFVAQFVALLTGPDRHVAYSSVEPSSSALYVHQARHSFEVVWAHAASVEARYPAHADRSIVADVVSLGAHGIRAVHVFKNRSMRQFVAKHSVSVVIDRPCPKPAVVRDVNVSEESYDVQFHGIMISPWQRARPYLSLFECRALRLWCTNLRAL
jgi:hypothetical protein